MSDQLVELTESELMDVDGGLLIALGTLGIGLAALVGNSIVNSIIAFQQSNGIYAYNNSGIINGNLLYNLGL
ncbi:MAG: class IIb bacteriocin, lactobin A/cerein 7B family [Propionibacteriaceae bacterium]|nr:class IIb bacteriocin, lactobin A/cerein 7B family [Propionibacteriaceae bacterium]